MIRQSKADRLAEVHSLALQQFEDSWNATRYVREDCLMARLFVNKRGGQWTWAEGKFDNKFMFELDLISGETVRIMNERNQNTIAAQFMPADGSDADEMADACAARYRADTQDIQGMEARAIAFKNALEGGFAGRRLRAEYENGKDGAQRICLEPVYDADSTLFFDVNAMRKDKSDAEHAFLIKPWSRAAFKAKYRDENASTWPEGMTGKYAFQWFGDGKDVIYVAEYFVKEQGTETTRIFQGFNDEVQEYIDDDLDDKKLAELLATGFTETDPRVEDIDRIRKYVLNGAKVLSDDGIIPGRNIPLVPQYGYWDMIGGIEHFKGHVLNKIDGQILFNLQVSKVGETAAASGIEKPVFTPEQMLGHAELWQNDHIANNAFMLINSITDAQGNPMPAGPIAFTKSPEVAPAVAALIPLTRDVLMEQFGNQQNTEMMMPNTSGVSMELAQAKADMRSAAFMDAEAEAEMRTAQIWQGMAAEIYVEKGRKLKTLTEDGKRGQVELGKKILDAKTGEMRAEIDFERAKFDVVIDVGPKSASKRMSVVRTISSIIPMTPDPETQVVLTHMALMNLEAEGMGDLREWSRQKLIGLGVVKPTPAEQAKMDMAASQQQQAPDPQAALAESLGQESQAKAVKAMADTKLAEAKTEQTQAETAKILTQIPMDQQKHALGQAQAIMGAMDAGQPNAGQ